MNGNSAGPGAQQGSPWVDDLRNPRLPLWCFRPAGGIPDYDWVDREMHPERYWSRRPHAPRPLPSGGPAPLLPNADSGGSESSGTTAIRPMTFEEQQRESENISDAKLDEAYRAQDPGNKANFWDPLARSFNNFVSFIGESAERGMHYAIPGMPNLEHLPGMQWLTEKAGQLTNNCLETSQRSLDEIGGSLFGGSWWNWRQTWNFQNPQVGAGMTIASAIAIAFGAVGLARTGAVAAEGGVVAEGLESGAALTQEEACVALARIETSPAIRHAIGEFPADPKEFLPNVPFNIEGGGKRLVWEPNEQTLIHYHTAGSHLGEPSKPGHYHVWTWREKYNGNMGFVRVRKPDLTSEYYPGDRYP